MDVMWGSTIPQYVPQKLRVLYVDHDSTYDDLLKDMFAYFSCEVTIVKLASTALAILSKESRHFDLVMENINSPDSYGLTLLQYATGMDYPVILLMDEDDHLMTMQAIEEGAIFCIRKPVTLEQIMYLWQHILRENIRKIKDNERIKGLMAQYGLHTGTGHETNGLQQYYKPMENVRYNKNSVIGDGVTVEEHNVVRSGKKDWTEWTPELHGKFMNAVRQLGEGRCYPKDILELMNVPGLTRMQVASHLQKCRSGDWQINHQRRHYPGYDADTNPQQFNIPPARSRRFGTMPRLEINQQPGLNAQDHNSSKNVVAVHNPCGQFNINEHDLTGLNDMLMCDAQSILDAHSGTSTNNSTNKGEKCNGLVQESAAMDNQMHHGQIAPGSPAA